MHVPRLGRFQLTGTPWLPVRISRWIARLLTLSSHVNVLAFGRYSYQGNPMYIWLVVTFGIMGGRDIPWTSLFGNLAFVRLQFDQQNERCQG